MEGQKGDNKPEQTSGDEAAKQSATELLGLKAELERERRRPRFLGVIGVYLVFVTTVISLGVLAYYAGHSTAMQLIFYVSVALLLPIPVGLVVYLVFSLHRRYQFLTKLASFGERYGYTIASYCALIALGVTVRCVWMFPKNPRLYLGEILANSATIGVWALSRIERQMVRLLANAGGTIDNVTRIVRILETVTERAKTQPPSKE